MNKYPSQPRLLQTPNQKKKDNFFSNTQRFGAKGVGNHSPKFLSKNERVATQQDNSSLSRDGGNSNDEAAWRSTQGKIHTIHLHENDELYHDLMAKMINRRSNNSPSQQNNSSERTLSKESASYKLASRFEPFHEDFTSQDNTENENLPETSGKWPNFAEAHSDDSKEKSVSRAKSGAFHQILK